MFVPKYCFLFCSLFSFSRSKWVVISPVCISLVALFLCCYFITSCSYFSFLPAPVSGLALHVSGTFLWLDVWFFYWAFTLLSVPASVFNPFATVSCPCSCKIGYFVSQPNWYIYCDTFPRNSSVYSVCMSVLGLGFPLDLFIILFPSYFWWSYTLLLLRNGSLISGSIENYL